MTCATRCAFTESRDSSARPSRRIGVSAWWAGVRTLPRMRGLGFPSPSWSGASWTSVFPAASVGRRRPSDASLGRRAGFPPSHRGFQYAADWTTGPAPVSLVRSLGRLGRHSMRTYQRAGIGDVAAFYRTKFVDEHSTPNPYDLPLGRLDIAHARGQWTPRVHSGSCTRSPSPPAPAGGRRALDAGSRDHDRWGNDRRLSARQLPGKPSPGRIVTVSLEMRLGVRPLVVGALRRRSGTGLAPDQRAGDLRPTGRVVSPPGTPSPPRTRSRGG